MLINILIYALWDHGSTFSQTTLLEILPLSAIHCNSGLLDTGMCQVSAPTVSHSHGPPRSSFSAIYCNFERINANSSITRNNIQICVKKQTFLLVRAGYVNVSEQTCKADSTGLPPFMNGILGFFPLTPLQEQPDNGENHWHIWRFSELKINCIWIYKIQLPFYLHIFIPWLKSELLKANGGLWLWS